MKVKVKWLSRVRLFATPWTVAHQRTVAPLSIEFSRQESWSGLPFLPPGDIPDPGIEPWSPALQADSLPLEPPEKLLIPLNHTDLSQICSRISALENLLLKLLHFFNFIIYGIKMFL